MKYIGYAVLAVAIVCISVFAVYRYCTRNSTPDTPPKGKSTAFSETDKELFFCEYHVFGGMENENLDIIIEREDDGNLLYTYVERDYESGEDKTDKRSVPQDAAQKIRDVCEKYCVFEWGELPLSGFEALDAPSTVLRIEIGDKSVNLSADLAFPEKGYMIFREIYDIMMSYRTNESE